LGDILLRGWCGTLEIDWVFLLLIQRDQEAYDDVADLMSGLDSEWVILGKSDIIPVDLAEATVAVGHQHLGFMLLPMIPIL
jgi:hypothetical protein